MADKKIALTLLVLLFCTSCFAAEIENSTTTQSVKATILIEGEGEITGNLRGTTEIEVLRFKETANQKILAVNEALWINGKSIPAEKRQDQWENDYALFKVKETGKFSYSLETIIETMVEFPDLQEYSLKNEISDFPQFSEPSENIESTHEAIKTVALNRFDSSSWLQTVVDVTQWTYDSVEYDLAYFPETYSALTTLETKKGVCEEFAVLAASMLRAKGIPTRVVTGLAYNSGKEAWDNHAWLEAFNPNTGWVALDPTFGEAGIVDGVHIARGFFPDPAESSVVKITTVQSASVKIEEETTQVEVQSSQPFGQIFSIKASNVVMPANKWHYLEIEAKNNLDGNAIGWFQLVLPVDFVSYAKKKIVLFKPEEEKSLVWKIRVDIELEENQYLTGTYKIMGLGQDLEKQVKVMPAPSFVEEAEITLVDIIPLVKDGKLVVEITVENHGEKKGIVEIEAGGFAEEFEISGFERQTLSVTIPQVENRDYAISIKGPGLTYNTTITVHEGTPFTKPSSWPDETLFKGEGPLNEIARYLFSLGGAVLASIVLGLVVIGLLLKELLSK